MSNTTLYNNAVMQKMNLWSQKNYSDAIRYLAEQCTCGTKYISCVEVNPLIKPDYDPGFVFFGPRDTMLAEVRWDNRGKCSGFIVEEKNIEKIRNDLARIRAERARAKSVNRNIEDERRRAQQYRTGLGEAIYFVKRNIKEVVAVAAFVAVLASSALAMNNVLNPEYINTSYDSGFQAVSMETHRTYDNEGYWHDYNDIAERYNPETMDFDSYVYGTYNNVGWNEQSRIDCMNSLFNEFFSEGFTNYRTFIDYCESKGAVKEKDGKMVVDTREFRNIMEDYMIELNNSQEQEKGINRL